MTRAYLSAYHDRKRNRLRQAGLRADGQCINGRHGPVLIGVRCPECLAVQLRHDLLPTAHRIHLRALRLRRELAAIALAAPIRDHQENPS